MKSILSRTKPYKAKSPEETVNWCKSILSELGLQTYEQINSTQDGNNSFYYCRVGFKEFPNYSAGGKGWNSAYALASGYGELLERLQNNLLIPSISNKTFKYAPDEKNVEIQDILKDNLYILTSIFNTQNRAKLHSILKSLWGHQITTIPYYDVFANKVHNFPTEIVEYYINMYNGNCAGNTAEEAIIHGICEIFERYAIREIYQKECTLPDIPLEYFEGYEIFDRIKFLEQKDISITIKDCSMGKDLPVIGAILVDKNTNRYSFQLGSDPSPITALERCFTEIFQDGRNFAQCIHLFDDPFKPEGYYDRNTLKYQNYRYTNEFARGYWPNSIFMPSPRTFKGFNHPSSQSDEKDLLYLFEVIKKNKKSIYIRNVGFLGFPSFNIYIPGMSEYVLSEPVQFVKRHNEFMNIIPILKNLHHYDQSNYEKLAHSLENLIKKPEPFIPYDISLFYKNINNEIGHDLTNELFLSLLYYKIENYAKSSFYMNLYIKQTGLSIKQINPYYLCIRDYISLKAKNLSPHHIKQVLSKIYFSDIVEEVIEDMKIPSLVFQHFDLPACPNCKECKIYNRCSLYGLQDISQKIYNKLISNILKQEEMINFIKRIKIHSNECPTQ